MKNRVEDEFSLLHFFKNSRGNWFYCPPTKYIYTRMHFPYFSINPHSRPVSFFLPTTGARRPCGKCAATFSMWMKGVRWFTSKQTLESSSGIFVLNPLSGLCGLSHKGHDLFLGGLA